MEHYRLIEGDTRSLDYGSLGLQVGFRFLTVGLQKLRLVLPPAAKPFPFDAPMLR